MIRAFLLAVLLSLLSLDAFASAPISGTCPPYDGTSPFSYEASNGGCFYHNNTFNTDYQVGFAPLICSDGSQPDTTKPTDQQCPDPPPCPPAGQDLGGYDYSAQAPVSSLCLNSCSAHTGGITACAFGTCYVESVITDGVACTGSPPPDWQPQGSQQCPSGTTQEGVDSEGIPICLGTPPKTGSNSTGSGSSTTTANPDGSKTTTTSSTTQNKDGSTTTTTYITTTDTSGNSTTTTTTSTGATPGGVSGTSDGQPDQQGDMCVQHPELTICKNSSVSGACGQITCLGDAIECSILQTTAKRNCDDQADKDAAKTDPMYTLGNQVASGSDPLGSSLPTPSNGSVVTMPSSLDNSGWLGGGSCFPDTVFSLAGHTFTLSFTAACQPLLVFRYALMIIALLISFRMLSGAIFKV